MAKKTFKYKGEEQTIAWDGRLCIHVGECGRAKGDLFEMGRDPWCDPDLASVEDAARVVRACPTGALTQQNADGTPAAEPAPDTNAAHVANDGPLYFNGDLSIQGADDMPGVTRRAALCRCGQSANKPFCDNAHRKADFKDAGAIGEAGLTLSEEGGVIDVNPIPNGPLEVKGNLSLYAGSGRKAWSGKKAYLCRCGASQNKPFCDGAHNGIGFKTD